MCIYAGALFFCLIELRIQIQIYLNFRTIFYLNSKEFKIRKEKEKKKRAKPTGRPKPTGPPSHPASLLPGPQPSHPAPLPAPRAAGPPTPPSLSARADRRTPRPRPLTVGPHLPGSSPSSRRDFRRPSLLICSTKLELKQGDFEPEPRSVSLRTLPQSRIHRTGFPFSLLSFTAP